MLLRTSIGKANLLEGKKREDCLRDDSCILCQFMMRKHLKVEEVQDHLGIWDKGCLVYTPWHPLASRHKHTCTFALTRTHKQISHPSANSTHSPGPSGEKQSFPLQLNLKLTIIESARSREFIEFHSTTLFLLFLFCFLYCWILFYGVLCLIHCENGWNKCRCVSIYYFLSHLFFVNMVTDLLPLQEGCAMIRHGKGNSKV